MNASITGFAIFVSFAATAVGQTPDHTLYFTNRDSQQGMQEATNEIRAVTEIPAVPDFAQRTLSLHGTAAQIALAEWLFNQLDRPAAQQTTAPKYDYLLPNGKTEIVSLFYFSHATTPQAIQETINAVRAISELTRIMPDNERHAMVARGSIERMGLAEWIFHQLDQEAPPAQQVQEYRLPPGVDPVNADAARVFYLSHITNPQDLQRVLNTMRSTTQITRIMPYSRLNAFVLRATDIQVAQAEQLVRQLDKPTVQ